MPTKAPPPTDVIAASDAADAKTWWYVDAPEDVRADPLAVRCPCSPRSSPAVKLYHLPWDYRHVYFLGRCAKCGAGVWTGLRWEEDRAEPFTLERDDVIGRPLHRKKGGAGLYRRDPPGQRS